MNIPLDEVIYFDAITTHPTTGAATDADSTPTFEVFEEATDTDIGVGGNLTKRTSKTGNYRGSFTLSAANGFEVGKWYNVIGSATVNSIAGKAVLKNFRVVAAEAIAGKPKVDVDAVGGTAGSTGVLPSGCITSNVLATGCINDTHIAADAIGGDELAASAITKIATGIWQDATAGDFTAANSIGKSIMNGVALGTGLTINAYTGNTPQTGDSFAIVNSGTHGNAAIKGYVDDIGIAGAGLSAIPWNTAWDAEVQSECDDALTAYGASTLNAAGIRTAVGMSSANLDTQLSAIVADTNELQVDWTNGGRLDLIVDSILDDTGTSGVAIAAATMNSIADATLIRGVSNVQDTADTTSLAAIILAILESSVSGTTWTIRKTGGTTFVTKTITTDAAADPITGVT